MNGEQSANAPQDDTMYDTLISTSDLQEKLSDPTWVVVDCRYTLAGPERGRNDYLLAHIPGAVYAHLDRDLSAPAVKGVTGRHPLPSIEQAAETFGRLGIGPGVQVVAYDDAGGALAAARLWWMLRWLGHPAAAVLDGGWQRWVGEGRPVRGGAESCPPRLFTPQPRPELLASAQEVEAIRQDPASRLIDARSPDRFGGRNETVDPVAGHIPGAINAPYAENLTSEGVFRSPEELRRRYESLLGETPVERSVLYCGSGVTAAHDLLAMQHAGLGEARLYAGSWSEWITDPGRAVEK